MLEPCVGICQTAFRRDLLWAAPICGHGSFAFPGDANGRRPLTKRIYRGLFSQETLLRLAGRSGFIYRRTPNARSPLEADLESNQPASPALRWKSAEPC